MSHTFHEFSTNAQLTIGDERLLSSYRNTKIVGSFLFVITKEQQIKVKVDGIPVSIASNSILSLTPLHSLQYIEGTDLIIYKFNREFYCIKDHDQQVGCAGLLFYGNTQIPIIKLDFNNIKSYATLHQVLLEELDNKDTIQAEMLRLLVARFIIKTTRLLKDSDPIVHERTSLSTILKSFNLMVEENFRKEHSVAFYASMLNKSPKTLSNSFAQVATSPLKIIHQRIILEAKRLLLYTDKTAKEISFEIGFDDASHLSRMFKKHTGISPSEFKLTENEPA